MAWTDLPGIGTILDLLCPPRCVFCHDDVETPARGEAVACDTCVARLSRDVPRCTACGEPLPASGGCLRCRGRRPVWDGLAVLAPYADDVRDAVLRAKRPAGEGVAAGLASLLVRKHRAVFDGWRIDTVVPVPMHWLRRVSRGTSAAHEIARGVAAGLGLPCRRAVRRTRNTRMQNELPFEDRHANLHGAFRPAARLAGSRVLLVDDVTTTGSTLAGCREVLVEAGATAVYAAVVARADRAATIDSES
ncbi:MAG: double zinc ribbon domain-containing protein [Planctomycetia bacterium]|nr:double zinc ribbon domain-containing protein [Planctomycetia bacterium]